MSFTKLAKLQGTGKSPNGTSRFTVDEWRKIHAARRRGVSWRDIHQCVGVSQYPTLSGFISAYTTWKSKYICRNGEH